MIRRHPSKAEWRAEQAEKLDATLACIQNPNGDPYRREHLQVIGETGLRSLYGADKITIDELEDLMAEMLRGEPDPLDD